MSFKKPFLVLALAALAAASFFIVCVLWAWQTHKNDTPYPPPPKTIEKKDPLYSFVSPKAELDLYPLDGAQWGAQLVLKDTQCRGGVGVMQDAAPARATMLSGDFSDGEMEIFQPPTVGEGLCAVRVKFENGAIVSAYEARGLCDTWHGTKCAFDTQALGGMRAAAAKTAN